LLLSISSRIYEHARVFLVLEGLLRRVAKLLRNWVGLLSVLSLVHKLGKHHSLFFVEVIELFLETCVFFIFADVEGVKSADFLFEFGVVGGKLLDETFHAIELVLLL